MSRRRVLNKNDSLEVIPNGIQWITVDAPITCNIRTKRNWNIV